MRGEFLDLLISIRLCDLPPEQISIMGDKLGFP